LAAKPLAAAKAFDGAGSAALISGQVVLVANVIGMADVAGAVSKAECMFGISQKERAMTPEEQSASSDGNGGYGSDAPINQPLGLTLYC
jgi:hypothetical protein